MCIRDRFKGKNFLVKELTINPKSSISLQKHNHRSEHWMITHGKPKITLNKKYFTMKPDETIFIPLGSVHRIENPYKKIHLNLSNKKVNFLVK